MRLKDKLRDFFGSLKFRLLITFLAIGIVPVLILQYAILATYTSYAVSTRTSEILAQSKLLGTQIINYNFLEEPDSDVVSAQLSQFSSIYDGRVMLVDSTFKIISDTYNMDTGKIIVSEEAISCMGNQEITKYDDENMYIEAAVPLVDSDGSVIGALIVSVSTDSIMANKNQIRRNVLLFQIAVFLVIVALSVGFSSIYTMPFSNLVKRIRQVHSGQVSMGQDVKNEITESKRVTAVVNDMLVRLNILEESRQEFVSNVSHELKTPLTSMKVLADSLNGQEDVPVELYREFMSDIADEIDRENDIINDLLSLVKMDRAANMKIETVSINDLIELVLKRLRPIAEEKNVELVLESFRTVTAEVDEVKLTLAVSNLVENAIKYNRPEGWVHVSLNADHEFFFIKISDSGIGMPQDSLDKIFERFYRVDKSHSREIGGTGLGLAITRDAVLVHHGDIKVHSVEDEGTTFVVRIPLNHVV